MTLKDRNCHSCTIEIWNRVFCQSNIRYRPAGVLFWVEQACQVLFILFNDLQRYSLFCVLNFILHNLWRHQYPICIIEKYWISLEGEKISIKEKHHPSFWKGFQIAVLWNLVFSFHRHIYRIGWIADSSCIKFSFVSLLQGSSVDKTLLRWIFFFFFFFLAKNY